MSLKEQMKLYKSGGGVKCGGGANILLDDIPLWPVLYKVNEPVIKKAIQTNSQGTFSLLKKRFSKDDDINAKVSLWQGDITKLEIDCVVNATSEMLVGLSGVTGAIHRAAGPALDEECKALKGCNPGQAKLTSGHKLPARHIIHTVAPLRWDSKHSSKLQGCYNSCFKLILENGIESVAFPCIGTGGRGYPNRDAAHVCLKSTREWLEKHKSIQRIIFCTFFFTDFEIYQELMADKYFPCTLGETVVPRKVI